MKNFDIGKQIKQLLQNTTLSNKIFPLIAPLGTTFPFVVYRRAGYIPRNTKDGMGERISVEFTIASETYSESVTLANELASAMIGKYTVDIDNIELANCSEMYLENTYLQNLTLLFELHD